MSQTSRVLMLYTGGTIGMIKTERGYVPEPGGLERQLRSMPPFCDPSLPSLTTPLSRFGRRVEYTIKESLPLLDSSNMGVDDWVRIARALEEEYDRYDAFLVLHGTDTMSYTASALSFMLEGLTKTVILTGAQLPLSQPQSDGIDNLLGALTIAGHYEIPEVALYFHHKLYRGNRTQKVDASDFDAFQSGNLPPLAKMGLEIEVHWDLILSPLNPPLQVTPITNRNVAALRIFPGITSEILLNFLRPPLEGLILETYGTGNAPDNRKDFLQALEEASARGVILVNCTQCHRGIVRGHYATGTALSKVGVISGADMTPEAALTKLSYLLSQGLPRDEIKRLMQSNLRGELTGQPDKTFFSFRDKAFIRSVAGLLSSKFQSSTLGAVERTLMPVLLCSAAALGDLHTLRSLVEGGADLAAPDYDGRTALHLAAAEGHLAVVKFLLERRAPIHAVDRWGRTPLEEATQSQREEIAALLRLSTGIGKKQTVEWKGGS